MINNQKMYDFVVSRLEIEISYFVTNKNNSLSQSLLIK
jgi:hypothetical protein